MKTDNPNKNKLYTGIVWIVSGLTLITYGILLSQNTNLPGAESLVRFLTNIDERYIYVTAMISIFIEGLYFVGSFFPGASLVLVIAIISQTGGVLVFLTTILLVFLSWSLAGLVNIYMTKMYRNKIIQLEHVENYTVHNRIWTTWFPAFRASYEVAQVAEGAKPIRVFISSVIVRFWASLFVGGLALVVPLFFNIQNTTNKDGYVTLTVVALISLSVGVYNIRKYRLGK